MRRREFIRVLGGAATTLSFAVQAQQPERIRRLGIRLPATADDAEFQTWIAAFYQALAVLGWNIGRNLRIDTRNAAIRYRALRAVNIQRILFLGSEQTRPLHAFRYRVPGTSPESRRHDRGTRSSHFR